MKIKLLILLILTFCFTVGLSAQTMEFSAAEGSGSSEIGRFAKWNFELGDNKYEISNTGRGKKMKSGKSVANFRIQLAKYDKLARVVYFVEYKGDLLLLTEATDAESGWGYLVRFDGKTLKPKWRATINGFNVGEGLIENRAAYVTAIGFVGKVDLETGKYSWKHDNLYRKFNSGGSFNSFEKPEFEGKDVIFTEKLESGKKNIIIVNKQSGKIVKTVLDGQ